MEFVRHALIDGIIDIPLGYILYATGYANARKEYDNRTLEMFKDFRRLIEALKEIT